jgi:hypothetical protein
MDTGFISGTKSVHTYDVVPPFEKKVQPQVEKTESPSVPPTQLQRARLTTEEVAQPFFEETALLFFKELDRLKGRRFSPSHAIKSSHLTELTQKTGQIKGQSLPQILREQKPSEYLQVCLNNLRDNFGQFYLRLIEEREIARGQDKI